MVSLSSPSSHRPGVRVGHVDALWRYPVKSMLGERLDKLAVEERGVVGDRSYALWDVASNKVASAKILASGRICCVFRPAIWPNP